MVQVQVEINCGDKEGIGIRLLTMAESGIEIESVEAYIASEVSKEVNKTIETIKNSITGAINQEVKDEIE